MGHVIWALSPQPASVEGYAGAESEGQGRRAQAGSVPWAPREVALFLNHCQLEVALVSMPARATHGS